MQTLLLSPLEPMVQKNREPDQWAIIDFLEEHKRTWFNYKELEKRLNIQEAALYRMLRQLRKYDLVYYRVEEVMRGKKWYYKYRPIRY